MITGIRDFIEKIKQIDGKKVCINTEHKLYGNQTIEMDLKIIDDECRLGFKVVHQDIYIEKSEIRDFGIIKGLYYFASDLMRIELKTI